MAANKMTTAIKDIINLIREDFRSEGFTRKDFIKYGIIYPLAFILLLGIVGHFEQIQY